MAPMIDGGIGNTAQRQAATQPSAAQKPQVQPTVQPGPAPTNPTATKLAAVNGYSSVSSFQPSTSTSNNQFDHGTSGINGGTGPTTNSALVAQNTAIAASLNAQSVPSSVSPPPPTNVTPPPQWGYSGQSSFVPSGFPPGGPTLFPQLSGASLLTPPGLTPQVQVPPSDVIGPEPPDLGPDLKLPDIPDLGPDMKGPSIPDLGPDTPLPDVPEIGSDMKGLDIPLHGPDLIGPQGSGDPLASPGLSFTSEQPPSSSPPSGQDSKPVPGMGPDEHAPLNDAGNDFFHPPAPPEAVLGRLKDTGQYPTSGDPYGYHVPGGLWTPGGNMGWLDEAARAGTHFQVVSTPGDISPEGLDRPTVTAQEIAYLEQRYGYTIKDGSLVPPDGR